MAEYKHQEQDLRAGLQHLANRNQEASATPAVLIHQRQVALAEAGLEAHRQHQAQVMRQRQVGAQHK
jgi:Tat protein secretion system quality control protein TatD with DNase activity